MSTWNQHSSKMFCHPPYGKVSKTDKSYYLLLLEYQSLPLGADQFLHLSSRGLTPICATQPESTTNARTFIKKATTWRKKCAVKTNKEFLWGIYAHSDLLNCLFFLRDSYTTHMKLQTGDREQTNHKHTHLLNGLSLCPLLLFESFFLGPPLWCWRGFHCQKVKRHPFVSLGRQRQTVSGG